MEDPLSRVVLAISSFRSDDSVLAILRSVFSGGDSPFGHVLVVDSLGSGEIGTEIERRQWPVRYINADRNLGSAGNLALRLATAAQTDARWCFTVNHDGKVDPEQVRKLVAHGEALPRVGAVYPSLTYVARGNARQAPLRTLVPRARFEQPDTADEQVVPVAWGSSNCALYSLQAQREDVEVWGDLWMGWEDLALGWLLGKRGWTQLYCRDVVVVDDYEYREMKVAGLKTFGISKPSWYVYYQFRNMLLIKQRTGGEACGSVQIAKKMVRTGGGIILTPARFKDKLATFQLMITGIREGLRGNAGKGPLP